MKSINGYKFENEIDAINAVQRCNEAHGLPKNNGETKNWVNYKKTTLDNNEFFYIIADESIVSILGYPTPIMIDNNF